MWFQLYASRSDLELFQICGNNGTWESLDYRVPPDRLQIWVGVRASFWINFQQIYWIKNRSMRAMGFWIQCNPNLVNETVRFRLLILDSGSNQSCIHLIGRLYTRLGQSIHNFEIRFFSNLAGQRFMYRYHRKRISSNFYRIFMNTKQSKSCV